MIRVKIVFNNALIKERVFSNPDVFIGYLKSLFDGVEGLKETDLNIDFEGIDCTIWIVQKIEKG
ncbi:MAG TPA: hypothetical protein ENG40_01205 [Thermoprotei archaeon]|nr:hypothetical protein [Thermoprotei archaeon]